MQTVQPYRGAFIHPLSALLVIVLDYLWTPIEGGAVMTGVGIVAVPLLITVIAALAATGVLLIQRFTAHDGWGTAFSKAFIMAVLAAIPFPIMSTVVGGVLLAWAGISALSGGVAGLLGRGR